jgi:CRISPR/Cas system-associated exonuclease Cas4 (RecB family)
MPRELPFVTASEVADYVFCKHSFYLRLHGVSISQEAQSRMDAGLRWQQQKDVSIPGAIHSQARARRASMLLWIALIIVLLAITVWELSSLLHY